VLKQPSRVARGLVDTYLSISSSQSCLLSPHTRLKHVRPSLWLAVKNCIASTHRQAASPWTKTPTGSKHDTDSLKLNKGGKADAGRGVCTTSTRASVSDWVSKPSKTPVRSQKTPAHDENQQEKGEKKEFAHARTNMALLPAYRRDRIDLKSCEKLAAFHH
jgi:hypothetical protein